MKHNGYLLLEAIIGLGLLAILLSQLPLIIHYSQQHIHTQIQQSHDILAAENQFERLKSDIPLHPTPHVSQSLHSDDIKYITIQTPHASFHTFLANE